MAKGSSVVRIKCHIADDHLLPVEIRNLDNFTKTFFFVMLVRLLVPAPLSNAHSIARYNKTIRWTLMCFVRIWKLSNLNGYQHDSYLSGGLIDKHLKLEEKDRRYVSMKAIYVNFGWIIFYGKLNFSEHYFLIIWSLNYVKIYGL